MIRFGKRQPVSQGERQPALGAPGRWYVAPALRVNALTAAIGRGAVLCASVLVVAGCGSPPRQDANEPEGEFPVKIVEAKFLQQQKLAKDSRLEIEVRNTGEETIPDANVTIDGFDRLLRNPANPEETDPTVADPKRPVFVVDRSPIEFTRDALPAQQESLVDREINPPYGRETAYVNTYSLGPLEPGATAVFRWDVSAVHAGPYEIAWEVNAGLDGKAEAVTGGGDAPEGVFRGTISDEAPSATVDEDDGETIAIEGGRRIPDNRGVIRNTDERGGGN